MMNPDTFFCLEKPECLSYFQTRVLALYCFVTAKDSDKTELPHSTCLAVFDYTRARFTNFYGLALSTFSISLISFSIA